MRALEDICGTFVRMFVTVLFDLDGNDKHIPPTDARWLDWTCWETHNETFNYFRQEVLNFFKHCLVVELTFSKTLVYFKSNIYKYNGQKSFIFYHMTQITTPISFLEYIKSDE